MESSRTCHQHLHGHSQKSGKRELFSDKTAKSEHAVWQPLSMILSPYSSSLKCAIIAVFWICPALLLFHHLRFFHNQLHERTYRNNHPAKSRDPGPRRTPQIALPIDGTTRQTGQVHSGRKLQGQCRKTQKINWKQKGYWSAAKTQEREQRRKEVPEGINGHLWPTLVG